MSKYMYCPQREYRRDNKQKCHPERLEKQTKV